MPGIEVLRPAAERQHAFVRLFGADPQQGLARPSSVLASRLARGAPCRGPGRTGGAEESLDGRVAVRGRPPDGGQRVQRLDRGAAQVGVRGGGVRGDEQGGGGPWGLDRAERAHDAYREIGQTPLQRGQEGRHGVRGPQRGKGASSTRTVQYPRPGGNRSHRSTRPRTASGPPMAGRASHATSSSRRGGTVKPLGRVQHVVDHPFRPGASGPKPKPHRLRLRRDRCRSGSPSRSGYMTRRNPYTGRRSARAAAGSRVDPVQACGPTGVPRRCQSRRKYIAPEGSRPTDTLWAPLTGRTDPGSRRLRLFRGIPGTEGAQ
ncbi:hypothetical protein HNQ79_005974 [Streptomyces candidus]|uniref:Uncharacterized protein n=1 Tax=Streptomyces candidus TaxID=67283 RepID=A0A7X0HN75_9ACTN|nr:hypothetical protein [Streptomyces candidus]